MVPVSILAENAADLAGKWAVAPLPKNAGSENSGDSGGAAVVVLKNSETPRPPRSSRAG